MNNFTAIIFGVVIGGVAVWYAIEQGSEKEALKSSYEISPQEVISVTSKQITSTEIPRMHIAAGQVTADQTIELSSRISGYISRLIPPEGALVDANELLVEIDAATVESAIRQANASLIEAQSELSDARADVKRFTELSKTNAISKEDVRKAKLRVTRAKATVESSEAKLAEHQAELAYAQIRSPVRARVTEHLSKAGDLAVPGTAILKLESLNAPHFETWVPISVIDKLVIGQTINLMLEGHSNPVKSPITELVRSADPVTRRCKVRLGIPTEITILVGHYGNAQFVLGTDKRPIVPIDALIQRAGIEGVFVIDDNDKARFRSVRTGRRWHNNYELLAGPANGTSVILNPGNDLRDGNLVITKSIK